MLARAVLRGLLFLYVVLMAHAVVSVALVPSTICPETCADDGPDGRCPPVCVSCSVTAHAVSPGYVPRMATPSVRPEAVPAYAALAPRDPGPRAVFHVPKSALA
jgi:hypothetical protein